MSLIELSSTLSQRRADRRRPDDAPVQHAGHAEVLHVGEAAGHLVRNVEARHRLADDLVVLRVLRSAGFVVELEREDLAADELAVADPLAAGADDAVGDREVLRLGAPDAWPASSSSAPCARRRRLADLHAAVLDRQAAAGRALVGRERGVALDDCDAVERHVELLGDDLRQRGATPVPRSTLPE